MSLESILESKVAWEVVEDSKLDNLKSFIEDNFDWSKVRQLSAIEKYEFRSTGSIILDKQLWGWFLKGWIIEIAWEASSWKTTTAVTTIKAMQDWYDYQIVELLAELIEISWSEINPTKFRNKMASIIESTVEDKQQKKYWMYLKILQECNYKKAKWEAKVIIDNITDILDNKWKTAYFDAEWALTDWWAVRLWIDADKVLVINVNIAENLFDQLDEVLWLHMYEIIVIDSIGSLTTNAENDASMDQQTMWLKARVMSKGMRKVWFNSSLFLNSPIRPTMICINHVYATMDQWNPVETPGGNALKFAYATRLFISRIWGKYVYAEDEADEKANLQDPGEQIWTYVRFKVVKNKTSSPKWVETTKLIFKKPLLEDWTEYDKISIWYNKYEEIFDVLESEWIISPEWKTTYQISNELLPDELEIQYLWYRKADENSWERFTWYASKFKNELKFNPDFFKACMNALEELKLQKADAFDISEIDLDDLK